MIVIFSYSYFNDNYTESSEIVLQGEHYKDPQVVISIYDIDLKKGLLKCNLKVLNYSDIDVAEIAVFSWHRDNPSMGPQPRIELYSPWQENLNRTSEFNKNFEFKFDGDPKLYPFDKYDAEFGIELSKFGTKNRSYWYALNWDAIAIGIEENLPDFDINNQKRSLTFQDEAFRTNSFLYEHEHTTFSFSLVRGLFIRWFTIFIYSIAFLLLIGIGFSRTINDLFEASLGYFAALWGIRNIISGKVDIFPTIIDYITLMLFSILLLIILGRLLHQYWSLEFHHDED